MMVVSADAKGEATVAKGRGALKAGNKGESVTESGCNNEIAEYGFRDMTKV
jgi:hypothetical protein